MHTEGTDQQRKEPEKPQSEAESAGLNSLGIMVAEAGTKNSMSENKNDKAKVESIGDAWMEEDGSITLNLRSTADGENVSAQFTYRTNDKDYQMILKHLNGLKQGEVKPVPPFPEKQ